MDKRISVITRLCGIGLFLGLFAICFHPGRATSMTSCTAWNLASDFRLHPGQANPNPDACGTPAVWHFMQSATLDRDPRTYTPLPNFMPNLSGVDGLQGWMGNAPSSTPLIGLNATDATQPPGTLNWPPHTIVVHPAPNQLAVVGWRSPVDASVSLTGSVRDIDAACGDGISWAIHKGTTSLASGSYANGGSQQFRAGIGAYRLVNIQVRQGDFIYVTIHPKGTYYCDSTVLELALSLSTDPALQATWNLAADFRTSPNQENPNRDSYGNLGVWRFMESTSRVRDPQTYALLQRFVPNQIGGEGMQEWLGTHPSLASYTPSVGLNTSGVTQCPNPPGTFCWPAGTIRIHPGPQQLAVVGWRSPIEGNVAVAGYVRDIDIRFGNGIDWYIDKNTTNLASGILPQGGAQNFGDGFGADNLTNVSVIPGDFLYFVIDPTTDYNSDSTEVDISITLVADGVQERYRTYLPCVVR